MFVVCGLLLVVGRVLFVVTSCALVCVDWCFVACCFVSRSLFLLSANCCVLFVAC